MIEFQKVNSKGDKVRAYTHRNYLSKNYTQTIEKLQKRNQTWGGVSFYGTTILTYWAIHKLPFLTSLVQNKLSFKGKFLAVSGVIGLVDSFFVSLILSQSLRSTHETLLKKEVFPAWLNQERVANPDRVFFELDDARQNEPNIYHSGITQAAVQNLIPDFIVGQAHRPHYPVAQHHDH